MRLSALLIATTLATGAFAADRTYTGYVVDVLCAKAGHGMDGSDILNAPQDHTVHCAIACEKGGYGLMVKEGTGNTFIPFDAKGNELALNLLRTTKQKNAPQVSVSGSLKMDILAVTSIKEVAM